MHNPATFRVVGLMSGTSADAIDTAIVELAQAGASLTIRLAGYTEHPFDPDLRMRLRDLLPPATGSSAEICELNVLLGEAFAAAAHAGVAVVGLDMRQIDLIGSHGQTVYHQVAAGHTRSTLQLGAPAVIAERSGRTVVADFRPRDIAAGGQGAPLVPFLDLLLWAHPTRTRAIQNIGGIANVTYLPGDSGSSLIAFDTGPGNALIDEATYQLSGGQMAYDQDGAWAATGRIDESLLDTWLADPYFMQVPPKSTGREYFDRAYARKCIEEAHTRGLNDAGALATLTALTAHSIAAAYRRWLPQLPVEVVISGGGARNHTLVAMLAQALPEAVVIHSDELGLPGAAKEAVAFAVFAYTSIHGWPCSVPACTGARHASLLGAITPGENYLELIRRIADTTLPAPQHASVEPGDRVTR